MPSSYWFVGTSKVVAAGDGEADGEAVGDGVGAALSWSDVQETRRTHRTSPPT
jgi:hypothetical protein